MMEEEKDKQKDRKQAKEYIPAEMRMMAGAKCTGYCQDYCPKSFCKGMYCPQDFSADYA